MSINRAASAAPVTPVYVFAIPVDFILFGLCITSPDFIIGTKVPSLKAQMIHATVA
jgi:hypothetical protein